MSTRRRHGILGVTSVLLAALLAAFYFSPSVLAQVSSNIIQLVGKPSGTAPQLKAQGQDANISINAVPKGTGCFQVNGVCIAGGSGSGTATEIAVWTSTGLTGYTDFTWNDSIEQLISGDETGLFAVAGLTGFWMFGNPTSIDGSSLGTGNNVFHLGAANVLDFSRASSISNVHILASSSALDFSQGSTLSNITILGDSHAIDLSQGSAISGLTVAGTGNNVDLSQGTTASGLSVWGAGNVVSLSAATLTAPGFALGTFGVLSHDNAAVVGIGDAFGGISDRGAGTLTVGVKAKGLSGTHGLIVIGDSTQGMLFDQTGGGTGSLPAAAGFAFAATTGSPAELTITSGQIAAPGVKAAGSAAGKRVVCIDNTTKILYTSASGTDCS